MNALKVAVNELEQKLFDLGFLADLPSSQQVLKPLSSYLLSSYILS